MTKYYSGVGSRSTPQEINDIIFKIAFKLAKQGVVLRTGAAYGADWAFSKGCHEAQGVREIYYPYQATPEGTLLASQYNSDWEHTKMYDRLEHGRSALLIAGRELNLPSTCLICWTKDGCTSHLGRTDETGRTGIIISLAGHFKVPIYNLKREDHLNQWVKWLEK